MSMGYKDLGYVTLPVADRLTENLRVKQDSGVCVIAGADTAGFGTVFDSPFDDPRATIALYNKPGTQIMIASDAINAGADVYAAADGKVSMLPVEAGTYYKIGIALTVAKADGDGVEVAPNGACLPVTV